MVKLGTGTVFRPTVSEETDILVALALETGVFKPIEIDALRKLLSDYFGPNPEEGHRAVTYESNGKPVGFAYFGPTEMTDRTWHLFWIFVDRATHARGIGAKIMDYVESEVRDSGGRAIIVETSGLPNY